MEKYVKYAHKTYSGSLKIKEIGAIEHGRHSSV